MEGKLLISAEVQAVRSQKLNNNENRSLTYICETSKPTLCAPFALNSPFFIVRNSNLYLYDILEMKYN